MTAYKATEQAMKAIISAAINSFADVVYFMFSPGKKNPANRANGG
ncbi:hypothetical protein [Citrobacter werkmanii]|nr:hypothetical protein [Citrobacter werkmanii]